MSAITAALSQIDRVAAEGDLAPEPTAPLELEAAGEPIVLPDGKRIYPPCLPGAPVGHERPAEPARLPAGGHLMTPANSTISARRPAVFVQQLHRAAAQRGRLDPVFQELSDHWTRVLQRLYPVWTLIGPGLSDPGHIEIHSRTV
ncbi:MAG: hypothetical protein ACLP8S_09470, partial [Solirubrobacteraceae bacterium]